MRAPRGRTDTRTRDGRGGGTTAPKRGGLGKQQGQTLLWEPWVGLGGSFLQLCRAVGLPKGSPAFLGLLGADPGGCCEEQIQVGAVRIQVKVQGSVGFPTLLELWSLPCTCRKLSGFQRQLKMGIGWSWRSIQILLEMLKEFLHNPGKALGQLH